MVSFGLTLLEMFFSGFCCFSLDAAPPALTLGKSTGQGRDTRRILIEFHNGSRDVLLAKLVGQCLEEEFKT